MPFAVGSLVRARGREWVVLPESEEELLVPLIPSRPEAEVKRELENIRKARRRGGRKRMERHRP